MGTIKVGIVDDHRLVRDGIKSLLSKSAEIEIAMEAEGGNEFLQLLESNNPDVVLIDLTMPQGLSGIETIKKARDERPWLKFIVLTMHEEATYILESVKIGAAGYLLKNVEAGELLQAIKTVAAGGKYFNASISGIMIESLSHPEVPDFVPPVLSGRELDVLKEVANGLSTKLIADKLNIGTRTVETHRANLMAKLHAANTAELIKKAFEHKLI